MNAVSLALRPPWLDHAPIPLYIGGRFMSGRGGTRPAINPADGCTLVEVAEGSSADLDEAVAAAAAALGGPWRQFSPHDRQRLLLRLADLVEAYAEELAVLETLDMGAPLVRTRANTRRAAQHLHWYAANAVRLFGEKIENSAAVHSVSYTAREPIGVVGAIIPWNSPLVATVWKIGPVLATGCTVVLKPAEEAPLVPLRFAELCAAAGIPDGVVNVVTGPGESVGARLALHPDVAKIAFTGSLETGRKIAAAAAASNLKRVTLELGGKSPNIVMADADMDRAVPGAAAAVFANSGQICSAGTRLFVESRVHDEFLERLANHASGVRVGHPLSPDTEMGPLASAEQLDRVLEYLRIGALEGGRAVTGGARLEAAEFADGFYIPPTVLADLHDDMRVVTEEIFGPVVSVLPFDDLEEVAARANRGSYGLASGVWTNSLTSAHRLTELLATGTVWVNCYQQMDPAVPFGGYKESGYGREGGVQQLDDYLNTKAVWIALP